MTQIRKAAWHSAGAGFCFTLLHLMMPDRGSVNFVEIMNIALNLTFERPNAGFTLLGNTSGRNAVEQHIAVLLFNMLKTSHCSFLGQP